MRCCALHFGVSQGRQYDGSGMDAKSIIYGETALDKLVQTLRASGQPQDITKLTERYLELLRELVLSDEQRSSAS